MTETTIQLTGSLIRELLRQVDLLASTNTSNSPTRPSIKGSDIAFANARHASSKRITPIQLTGFSPTQWVAKSAPSPSSPSSLESKMPPRRSIDQVKQPSSVQLQFEALDAMSWLYLYVLSVKLEGNIDDKQVFTLVDNLSITCAQLKEQLVSIAGFIGTLVSEKEATAETTGMPFDIARDTRRPGDARFFANRQRSSDSAIELIMRINYQQDSELFRKKAKWLAENVMHENVHWLAEMLVGLCASLACAPSFPAPSTASAGGDRMAKLESRLRIRDASPCISLSFEDATYGESVLFALLWHSDSHRLVSAVMAVCEANAAQRSHRLATRLLICRHLLSGLRPMASDSLQMLTSKLPFIDRIQLIVDYQLLTGNILFAEELQNAAKGCSDARSLFYAALLDHISSSDESCNPLIQFTPKKLQSWKSVPKAGLKRITAVFGHILPPLQLLFISPKCSAGKPRKVRPIPVHESLSVDSAFIATPPDLERLTVNADNSAKERAAQERMRFWFWWRYPHLKDMSASLAKYFGASRVSSSDGSSSSTHHREEDIVLKESLRMLASVQSGKQWHAEGVKEEMLRQWTLLTTEMIIQSNNGKRLL